MEPTLLTPLRHFVMITKLHPVLVNFTAGLIPASVASDLLARHFKKASFRDAAWWTLVYAVIITPFTAISGWLFWMPDDNGVIGMTVHKWLGTALAVLLAGLFFWRRTFYKKQLEVSRSYLAFGLMFVAALVLQGHLGGEQVFSGM